MRRHRFRVPKLSAGDLTTPTVTLPPGTGIDMSSLTGWGISDCGVCGGVTRYDIANGQRTYSSRCACEVAAGKPFDEPLA